LEQRDRVRHALACLVKLVDLLLLAAGEGVELGLAGLWEARSHDFTCRPFEEKPKNLSRVEQDERMMQIRSADEEAT
jgi:hypothetical protein